MSNCTECLFKQIAISKSLKGLTIFDILPKDTKDKVNLSIVVNAIVLKWAHALFNP